MNQLKPDFPKSVISKNTTEAINKAFLPHTQTEVAMYGMSSPRSMALDAINKFNQTTGSEDNINIKTSTVDEYNAQSGIMWSDIGESTLPLYLDDIKN